MSRSKRRSSQRNDKQGQPTGRGGGSRRGRPILFRLTAIFLGFLVVLFTTEVTLRIVGYEPATDRYLRVLKPIDDPSRTYSCFPENPYGDFSPLPDTSHGRWLLYPSDSTEPMSLSQLQETPWTVEYRMSQTSNMELRDREMPGYWPPEGQTRIACVGDSFTFGQGVPMEKTLSRQLERELGAAFQVPNVAYIGWDTQEEMAQLQKFRKNKHCSRALFIFLVNDLMRSKELFDREQEIFELVRARNKVAEQYDSGLWQVGPSKIAQWIHSHYYDWQIGRQTVEWYADCFDREKNAVGLSRFEQQLKHLANLKGCEVAIAIYPLIQGFEKEYPLQEAHDVVRRMATDAGIPVVDLLPAFAGQDTTSLWVHPADTHPNGKAHAIAAKAIAEWLRRDLPHFLEPEVRN